MEKLLTTEILRSNFFIATIKLIIILIASLSEEENISFKEICCLVCGVEQLDFYFGNIFKDFIIFLNFLKIEKL